MAITLNGDGTVTGMIMPTGSVIQAKHSTTTVGNASSGADFENYSFNSTAGLGLSNALTVASVSITPKYATSSLLIMYSINPSFDNASGDVGMDIWLTQDGSNVLASGGNRNSIKFAYNSLSQGAGHDYFASGGTHLISVDSTDATTIALKANRYNDATSQVYFRHDGSNSLTVLEIAG